MKKLVTISLAVVALALAGCGSLPDTPTPTPTQGTFAVTVAVDVTYNTFTQRFMTVISKGKAAPGKNCYGVPGTVYGDIGHDSEVFIADSKSRTASGSLKRSYIDGDNCKMSYEISGVPDGSAPYEVQVGGRKSGTYSEAELRSGLHLTIGG